VTSAPGGQRRVGPDDRLSDERVIVAVLPALDERETVGDVVRGLRRTRVDRVIVVDNGSRDDTGKVAEAAGAHVIREPRRGYGSACIAGIDRAVGLGATVVVLLDADGSDDPSDLASVLDPVLAGRADLSLGVRNPKSIEPGAMTPSQRFGNWLAPRLMFVATGARYSDMPPFKAITAQALARLELRDKGHGFTVELLLKAHACGLSVSEVPVQCRRRAGGRSKVSGTLLGTLRASVKIVTTIGRHSLLLRRGAST
jgi:glycosyltransferase involved in cell wall biosynthesis